MKVQTMFPYRRGNKKRGKGGGMQRRHRDGGPRRVPGSAHELLSMLQPTTKALAQVLAGNAKASGQIAHARGVLAQAERLIDDRQVDRMIPAQREEFFEQLARLKLTLADAEADLAESVEPGEASMPRPAPPAVSMEKLRALALSLAAAPAPAETSAAAVADQEPEERAAEPEIERAPVQPRTDIPANSPRSARLRLRSDPRRDHEGAP
jgi:hypothetical protein